jgi:hypothetical protein
VNIYHACNGHNICRMTVTVICVNLLIETIQNVKNALPVIKIHMDIRIERTRHKVVQI